MFDKDKYIDYIARLFSLAVNNKNHPETITDVLANSDLLKDIENNKYDLLINNRVIDNYKYIFSFIVENEMNNYDIGYWCGYIYMNIFYKYAKPFSYIFLVLPLKELLVMYPVYHEMDISEVYEQFEIKMSNSTIMKRLLKKYEISATELSRKSKVSLRVIEYFKASDDNLYKASYLNIQRIVLTLNLPNNLFLNKLEID